MSRRHRYTLSDLDYRDGNYIRVVVDLEDFVAPLSTIIVAYDKNRVIGYNGVIPWTLPEDMRRFKRVTNGHAVIMGRKTWESLPKKPLPNRLNIVVSKSWFPNNPIQQADEETYFVHTFEAAFDIPRPRETFLIGGERIYRRGLELGWVNRMLVTKVDGEHDGDAYFPEFDLNEWEENALEIYDTFEVVEFNKRSLS